jgi:multidrug efflux pump
VPDDSCRHPWDAVIVATEHRLRPILLTAAAAILGMIPIAPTVFWGPMAYAVIGGLMVATLLTLVFLPALYVAWFRVQPTQSMGGNSSSDPDAHPRATEIVERLKGIAARSKPALQQS